MKNLVAWKTTLIGLALAIGAGMYVWEKATTTSEQLGGAAFILVGIGLIFAPDEIIKIIVNRLKKKNENK